ncbi:hypothetical protein [uncultured Roseobacter sp.]|uniref:hypothetical protein n=1 Tax=uncultured Roseobacter sp. TaxID=114847 RepID=UPI0026339676|nr:hypothetical protein [uncultured Roseobacter sp.]
MAKTTVENQNLRDATETLWSFLLPKKPLSNNEDGSSEDFKAQLKESLKEKNDANSIPIYRSLPAGTSPQARGAERTRSVSPPT